MLDVADAALRRLLDVTVAGMFLLVLAPLLGVLALLVRATSTGPRSLRWRGNVADVRWRRSPCDGAPFGQRDVWHGPFHGSVLPI